MTDFPGDTMNHVSVRSVRSARSYRSRFEILRILKARTKHCVFETENQKDTKDQAGGYQSRLSTLFEELQEFSQLLLKTQQIHV